MNSTFQRAVQLHTSGKVSEALALYRSILKSEPRNFDCLYRQGIALAQLERYDEAAKWIGRALKVKPDFAQGHLDLGNLHARAGRYKDAAAGFRAALRLDDGLLDAHHNLGNALQELGRHEEALACYDAVLARDPDHAPSHFNRGNALKALGRFEDARADYQAALARRPDFVPALNNLGLVLLKLGRAEDALARFQRALALRPGHPEYLNNIGLALDELNQLDDALASFDRALTARPDYAEALYNRGITLKKQGKCDDARASYEAALRCKPDYAEAHNNLGLALQELNRWDDAEAAYDRAVALKPAYSNALWNRSLLRLLRGDFARGWEGFEQRWGNTRALGTKENFAPEWDGGKLDGPLLVLNEQGVGDEIFYGAMLNDLRPRVSSITVCVEPRLVDLFRRSFDGINVMSRKDLMPGAAFDAQVYMASLGRHFHTGPQSFGNIKSPYLRADAARARALRGRVSAGEKRICGLSWFSKNVTIGTEKSLRLMDLVPILKSPEMAFVDLQYGDTDAEQTALRADTGLHLTRVPDIDNFNDLDGLAALIDACDIVLTVSNTTAHLAAALGKPTLVMLSFSPGLLWYWHVDRDDSPWYPGVQLFRQARPGDWAGVIERAGKALRKK